MDRSGGRGIRGVCPRGLIGVEPVRTVGCAAVRHPRGLPPRPHWPCGRSRCRRHRERHPRGLPPRPHCAVNATVTNLTSVEASAGSAPAASLGGLTWTRGSGRSPRRHPRGLPPRPHWPPSPGAPCDPGAGRHPRGLPPRPHWGGGWRRIRLRGSEASAGSAPAASLVTEVTPASASPREASAGSAPAASLGDRHAGLQARAGEASAGSAPAASLADHGHLLGAGDREASAGSAPAASLAEVTSCWHPTSTTRHPRGLPPRPHWDSPPRNARSVNRRHPRGLPPRPHWCPAAR